MCVLCTIQYNPKVLPSFTLAIIGVKWVKPGKRYTPLCPFDLIFIYKNVVKASIMLQKWGQLNIFAIIFFLDKGTHAILC